MTTHITEIPREEQLFCFILRVSSIDVDEPEIANGFAFIVDTIDSSDYLVRLVDPSFVDSSRIVFGALETTDVTLCEQLAAFQTLTSRLIHGNLSLIHI